MLSYPCYMHTKCFIILEDYGSDYYTLSTPIPPPSTVQFMAKYVILHGGYRYRVCREATVAPAVHGHVDMSMLRVWEVFYTLGVLWIWLLYSRPTNSTNVDVPVLGKNCAMAGRVWGVVGGNGDSRWSRSCFHKHVASIHSVLYPWSVVDLAIILSAHQFHQCWCASFGQKLCYGREGMRCSGQQWWFQIVPVMFS
jgi:hypothetical protein